MKLRTAYEYAMAHGVTPEMVKESTKNDIKYLGYQRTDIEVYMDFYQEHLRTLVTENTAYNTPENAFTF